MKRLTLILLFVWILPNGLKAQIDEGQPGAWYMYFWNTSHEKSAFGFQGDIQHRNWNILGDLQQLMLRGGVTYKPEASKIKLTLGYANITTGTFGDSDATINESRIYQEALIPKKIGSKLFTNHRIRLEQRFVENQDFRTRFRYNLFLNIPLNQDNLGDGAIYLAFYNEVFLNGQKKINENARVKIFDRNRAYMAVGHSILDNLKVQLGYMVQSSPTVTKGQFQISLHHQI